MYVLTLKDIVECLMVTVILELWFCNNSLLCTNNQAVTAVLYIALFIIYASIQYDLKLIHTKIIRLNLVHM